MPATIITVNDLMQSGYRYELTEPEAQNFHPDFKPELTPAQLLEMGVFVIGFGFALLLLCFLFLRTHRMAPRSCSATLFVESRFTAKV